MVSGPFGLLARGDAAVTAWRNDLSGPLVKAAAALAGLAALPAGLEAGWPRPLSPALGRPETALLLSGVAALILVVSEGSALRRFRSRPAPTPERVRSLLETDARTAARAVFERARRLDPAGFRAERIVSLGEPLFQVTDEERAQGLEQAEAWRLPEHFGGWVLLKHSFFSWTVVDPGDELLQVRERRADSDELGEVMQLCRRRSDGKAEHLAHLREGRRPRPKDEERADVEATLARLEATEEDRRRRAEELAARE